MAETDDKQAQTAASEAESPARGKRAQDKGEAAAAEKKAEGSKTDAGATEDTFEVSDLIARSTDFLGQPSFVTAGALFGVEGELTLADAESRVQAYLDNPVSEEA